MLAIDTNVLVRFLVRDDDEQFEDEPAVEEALFFWTDSTAEFANCLIGAHNRGLGWRATATFDAKALRLPAFVVI